MRKKETKESKDNWDYKTRIEFVMWFIHRCIYSNITVQDAVVYAVALTEIMTDRGVNIDFHKSVSDWLYEGCQKDFKDCDELYDLMDEKVIEIIMRNITIEFTED